MSKALNMADAIRSRIITAPGPGELATDVDLTTLADSVIVDRQKNITAMVNTAVAKAQGTAVTILWDGFKTADVNSSRPKMEHAYTIMVYSKPVIAGAELAADDVMASVIARLWQWRPTGGHAFGEARLGSGGLVPNKSFLIYDLSLTIPILH